MSIILEQDGAEETVLKNAAKLIVREEGIEVSALFDEPKIIKNAVLREIDFLDGKVKLRRV
jgi:predicted RNA-binding protein